MNALILGLGLALAVIPAAAQRHKLTINAETPEGQLLQNIGTEQDPTKKLALLEEFEAKHPKHEAIAWVYAQLQPAYAKNNQFDKAMAATEKLLAIDPEDVELAHGALKAAEASKNPDHVRKWAETVSSAARKVAASKKPEDEDEVEEWKRRVDFSKQVDTYCEYALFATALQTDDPKKKIELFQALEKVNPQSQYIPQSLGQQFLAYSQAGDRAGAVAIAEKVLATDQTNEDMLLAAASHYYEGKKDLTKALDYAGKIVTVLATKAAPEGVSAADWENKKNQVLGVAHWMTGVALSNQSKWAPADKSLRAALPLLKGPNAQLLPETLFHLGLANYKLGDAGSDQNRILDAVKFNEQCAAIASPFQAQARKNLAAIRSQYHIRK